MCQHLRPWHSFLGFALYGLASETALTGIAASGTIRMVHILREHSRDGEMAEKLPMAKKITTSKTNNGEVLGFEGKLWQGPDKIRILMGDETTRRTISHA